jgi:hypothetical protein
MEANHASRSETSSRGFPAAAFSVPLLGIAVSPSAAAPVANAPKNSLLSVFLSCAFSHGGIGLDYPESTKGKSPDYAGEKFSV